MSPPAEPILMSLFSGPASSTSYIIIFLLRSHSSLPWVDSGWWRVSQFLLLILKLKLLLRLLYQVNRKLLFKSGTINGRSLSKSWKVFVFESLLKVCTVVLNCSESYRNLLFSFSESHGLIFFYGISLQHLLAGWFFSFSQRRVKWLIWSTDPPVSPRPRVPSGLQLWNTKCPTSIFLWHRRVNWDLRKNVVKL